jgi:hypothetical protein
VSESLYKTRSYEEAFVASWAPLQVFQTAAVMEVCVQVMV